MAELDESIPVELWTPEDAARALESNSANYRPLKPSLIEKYAGDMSAVPTRWHFTGDAIKFDQQGRLADGQNRLSAQVKCGATIRWAVIRDLPPEATMVMDTGKARTAADHLQHGGHPHSVNLAATARRILMDTTAGRKATGVSVAEINDLVNSDPHLVRIATVLINDVPYAARTLATSMVISYAWWRLHKVDPYRAAEFFTKLDSQADLPVNSPILALSKRLLVMKRERGHGQVVNNERIATIIYAWNAWIRDEPRTLLRTVSRKNGQIIMPEPAVPKDAFWAGDESGPTAAAG